MTAVYVITADGQVHFREGPQGGSQPGPAGITRDLGWTLTRLAQLSGPMTLVYDRDPGGGTSTVPELATVAGWDCKGPAQGPWWTAYQDGRRGRTVTIGVREYAKPEDLMIAPHMPPELVRDSLFRWAAATGTAYSHSPGVAAINNLRDGPHPIYNVQWRLIDGRNVMPWKPPAQINDIRWESMPGNLYAGPTARYDLRSAYLAALAAVDLPRLKLSATGHYRDAAGYFRIRCQHALINMLGRRDRQGTTWVCHPVARQLDDLGVPFEVIESHTAPATRILRPWGEAWRDILAGAAPEDRILYKRAYSEAVGMLNVSRGRVYRPDWRHMIIDQVRASMLRRAWSAWRLCGILPARIDVDSMWFAVDFNIHQNLDQLGAAVGVGDQAGRMRFEGITEGAAR